MLNNIIINRVMRFFIDVQTLLPAIIASAIVLVMVVSLIISFSISRKNDFKHVDKIEDLSSSVRIYIVDLKNDTVKYFNRSSLKAIKTSSIIDFYNQFRVDERMKLIKWVSSILDPEKRAKDYLEINTLERRRKKVCFSILQVQKVDYENKIIHFESYLLRLNNEKPTYRKTVSKFSTKESFELAIKNSNFKKGFTFAIDFFHKNPDQRSEDLPRLIFAQVKNMCMNYISPTRPILEYSNHELVISDLKAQSKSQMLSLITELRNDINKLLLISSFSDEIMYTIGAVENRFFPRDNEKLVSTAIEIAEYGEEEVMPQISWYEPGRSFETTVDSAAYRTEVERIIRDNNIRYLYRAIYDAERGRIFGYEAFIRPIDSFFSTIEELKNYAIKTGDDRELFSTITRKCISRYIAERDETNLRLFFPISYKERHYVIRTLSHIQKIKEMHLVIVLNEADLNSIVDIDEEEIIQTLRSFKSKGYEVAIEFVNHDMPYAKKVYAAFDFYLIDVAQTLFDKSGNRTLTLLRGFAERLIHYHKTIISTNIPTWDSVELMIRLGLANVSSDSIAPLDEMILPVSAKSAQRIKKVVDSQGDKYGK